MPVLNGQVVGDTYPPSPGAKGAIIANVWNSRGGWFSVTGATAYVELQYGTNASDHWVEEILLGAGAFVVLPPNCVGIQFRNGQAGVPATVTAQIAQGDEPPLAISTIGQTNTVTVASLNFQHNTAAVATQPTVDFEDAAFLQFSTLNDVPGTRVKVGLVNVSLADKAPATQQLFTGPVGSGSGSTAVGAAAGTNMGTTGLFSSASAAATTSALNTTVTGDTTDFRFKIRADGQHTWASGTANADVTLARSAANQLDLGTTTQEGRLRLFGAAGSDLALQFLVTTDTNPRLQVGYNGSLLWGAGAAAGDVQLGRNSAGVLFVLFPPLGTPANLSGIFVDWVWTGAVNSTSVTNQAFQASLSTDTNPRYQVNCDGKTNWGPGGTGAFDTVLGRASAGVLNLSTGVFTVGPSTVAGVVGGTQGVWMNNGSIVITDGSGAAGALGITVAGDTGTYRLFINGSGTMSWSSGTAAADVTLARSAANQLDLGTTTQEGRLRLFGAAAADLALQLLVTTDTNPRHAVAYSGALTWGPGSGATDTTLARSSAGNLTLTGGLFVSGSVASAMGGDGASPAANAPGAAAGAFLNAGGVVQVSRTTSGQAVFTVTQPGDATNFRFVIDNNGRLEWGTPPSAPDVFLNRVVSGPTGTGSFLELTGGAGFGYGTGTGGAVTQATSRTTGVTINKPSGQITTNTTSLANGATAAFVVTNSVVGADDTIILTLTNQAALTPLGLPCQVMAVGSGSFTIAYTNNTGGALVSALIFNYAVIKGAVS